MLSSPRGWNFTAAAMLLTFLLALSFAAHADVVQDSPTLPPTTGAYTAPTICVQIGPGVCIVNPRLFGFNGTTSTFSDMGQAIDSNIYFTADIYSETASRPGTFLGMLNLAGPIGIFYDGRSTADQLGTFTSTLTELDMTGMFNGHSIEVILGMPTSSGPTTITQLDPLKNAPDGQFAVSSFFDVFAEISIDHGTFVQGPMRTFTLNTVPEPGTLSMLALGLAGLSAGKLRRRIGSLLSR